MGMSRLKYVMGMLNTLYELQNQSRRRERRKRSVQGNEDIKTLTIHSVRVKIITQLSFEMISSELVTSAARVLAVRV